MEVLATQDLYGFAWICVNLYGFVWICMDMYGFAWICMNLYGFVWICMDLILCTGFRQGSRAMEVLASQVGGKEGQSCLHQNDSS